MLVRFNLRQFRGPWRWATGEPPLEVLPPPQKNDSLVMFLAVQGIESEDLWGKKKILTPNQESDTLFFLHLYWWDTVLIVTKNYSTAR